MFLKLNNKKQALSAVMMIMTIVLLTDVSAGGLGLFEMASPEQGTASAGRNALADSASTAIFNPAGMTRLDRDELMAGYQQIYADIRFDSEISAGGGDGGNAGGWMPSATLAYVHELSPDLKFGYASFSYMGLGIDYGSDWGGRYFITEGEFQTLTNMFTLGYKINEQLSVGAGVSIVYAKTDQKLAWNNLEEKPDGKIKIKDSDFGYGLRLGLLYQFSQETRIGLTYQSKVDLDFDDVLDTSGLIGLPDALLGDAKVDMEMTLPEVWSFSLFHQLNTKWALLGSVGWQGWSEFGKSDIKFNGNKNSNDRNFDDIWNVAAGVHYQWSEPWKLMAGISYDESPVSNKDRTIDSRFSRQVRYAFGAQYDYSKDIVIYGGYELMDSGEAKIDQTGIPRQGTLKGKYDTNYVHFLNIGARWKF